MSPAPPRRILVVGIILADREHLARTIIPEFAASRRHRVDQKWVSLFGATEIDTTSMSGQVAITEREAAPRSDLLNELIRPEDLETYDFVFIADDDVLLPKRFLDDYIDLVETLDFSLSQPARTWYSEIGHTITKRERRCIARETLFVEIGPLVCVRSDAFPLVFPIPEASGMGWGLDFVWAHHLSVNGKRLGIIDALPIDHSIRATGNSYSVPTARQEMRNLLDRYPHLSKEESLRNVHRYVRIGAASTRNL